MPADRREAVPAVWRAMAARWGAGVAVVASRAEASDRRTASASAVAEASRAARAPLGEGGHEPDGRRRWPRGWTGSVSHRAGMTIALVRPAGSADAIGVDIEEAGALTVAEAGLVLRPEELAHCRRAADPAVCVTLTWSVKEAAFKAWSTVAGGLPGVDPLDIAVSWDGTEVAVVAVAALATRVAPQPLIGDVDVGGPLTLAIVGVPSLRARSSSALRTHWRGS